MTPATDDSTQSEKAVLVAFVETQAAGDEGVPTGLPQWQSNGRQGMSLQLSSRIPLGVVHLISDIERTLSRVLPLNLIPYAYVPLQQMPADRTILRTIGATMSRSQLGDLKATIASVNKSSSLSEQPQRSSEKRLQQLWSKFLGLDTNTIGVTDNFFTLGGDSIMAMKLVAAVRLDGSILTVAEVFRNPRLVDMASLLDTTISQEVSDKVHLPFSALDIPDVAPFLAKSVKPRLGDSNWKILDVLPTTHIQVLAVEATVSSPRFSVQYVLLDLDGIIDEARLLRSCQETFASHDILRTVFIRHGEEILQVVLENVDVPVATFQADCDLQAFSKQLCVDDCNAEIAMGSLFAKFLFVKGQHGRNSLIMRLSHAQYDGVSLPRFLLDIRDRYEGRSIPESPPFSRYIHEMIHTASDRRLFWRDLLQGSSITILPSLISGEASTSAISISRNVDVSARPKEFTLASLLPAAWSVVLARVSNSRDVTFGQVVSGRCVDIPKVDSIMGPCYQYVPFRVRFQKQWSAVDLLRYVQEQYISKGPHEATNIDEIVRHCVDWPEGTDYDSIVQHQEVDDVDVLDFDGTECRIDALKPHEEPSHRWRIQSYAQNGKYRIEIVCPESWKVTADDLIGQLESAVSRLVEQPNEILFE